MKKISVSITLVSLLTLNVSCGQNQKKTGETNTTDNKQKQEYKYTNHLIQESSPYLLMHAHNPVDWYPWGEKALKKAKDENKMIVISIGYAACHWCHVMEKESYEDTAVARIMNENFVSIKVDREERPDIDQIYMNASELITGSGGWPLNVLAMPDGKPFYAGTYFPRNDWIQMLNYFIDLHKKNPTTLKEQAAKVTQGISAIENIPFKKAAASFTMNDLNSIFNNVKPDIDFKKGGEKRAPKFPMPAMWEYLLYYHYLSNNSDALNAVKITLNNMANGGIYDHVGGGFARYSTDADWHVPHFEKMLYDNAQLVSLYADAWRVTKDPLYKNVVYETLGFIQREMTSPEGGFYSSLDADSQGEEGKFYVWSKDEIEKILKDDDALFSDYFNITKTGNWQPDKNILYKKETNEAIASKYHISLSELNSKIEADKIKLLQGLLKRVHPNTDDKMLTAWNALMLKAYVQAYRVFDEEKFLHAALKNADFLIQHAIGSNNEITRNYKNGKSSVEGFLDDYAFTISAFIELYQATFDEQWLYKAKDITEYTLTHFFDSTSGMFYYTHNEHSDLIARKMEVADNVIPSYNSEMAKNLFYLGNFFSKDDYIKTAQQMLVNVQNNVQQNILFYANWGMLEADFVNGIYEVAIAGKNDESKRREMDQYYLPNIILSGGKENASLELLENKFVEYQTIIYVCRNKVCKLPVTEVSKAVQQILK